MLISCFLWPEQTFIYFEVCMIEGSSTRGRKWRKEVGEVGDVIQREEVTATTVLICRQRRAEIKKRLENVVIFSEWAFSLSLS